MQWLLNKFFRDKTANEAFERFIMPHVKKAKEAGLSDELIDKLVREAIDESDGVLKFPGMLLRDKVHNAIDEKG